MNASTFFLLSHYVFSTPYRFPVCMVILVGEEEEREDGGWMRGRSFNDMVISVICGLVKCVCMCK